MNAVQDKRILQTAFCWDSWLRPDSSCHSLPVPPSPASTGSPFTSGATKQAENLLSKRIPQTLLSPHLFMYLSLSPTNTALHQVPGWAGEIPSPMAESFHLTAVLLLLLISLSFIFPLFLHPLQRTESWKSLELSCDSSGMLEEPSPAGGQLSKPFLSPCKASAEVKGLAGYASTGQLTLMLGHWIKCLLQDQK